jgi:hypothetical protein
MRCILAVTLLVCLCVSAESQTFDQLLGNFALRRSGVCVIYAHVMAVCETDPTAFASLVHEVYGGWMVKYTDSRRTYVTREEVEKSIANNYSAGDVDNLLTIYSIALSKRSGGFDKTNGMLDYGDLDFAKFLGTRSWILYDNGQVAGQKLSDGLDRLVREALPDGRIRTPSTVGFGGLDAKSLPAFAELIEKYKLVGIHDFSVSSYDAAKKMVYLRNPHNPQVLMEVPIDLLRNIPAGIDFMVAAEAK